MNRPVTPAAERARRRLVTAPCPLRIDRLGRPIVTPCRLWPGCTIKGGYGLIHFNRERGPKLVHRVIYADAHSIDVDDAPELDHLCRVRNCAEVTHLDPCTHVVNAQRGDTGAHNRAKTHCPQRHPYGEPGSDGKRRCRICMREAGRKYDREKRGHRIRPQSAGT